MTARVLGAQPRDLKLFKDVGKVALASVLAGVLCFAVRRLMVAGYSSPLVILAGCCIVFASVYVGCILVFKVATFDEREKVRRGVERLQQFVYG